MTPPTTERKRRSTSAWFACLRGTGAALLVALASACASGSRGEAAYEPRQPAAPPVNDEATDQLNRRISLAAARAAQADGADEDMYRIGPDDQLDIQVFSAEAFSGLYRVSGEGEISLPLLGTVDVAGQTPRALEQTLEDRLAETYMREPSVTVQVAEMQSRAVSVIGAVTTPGVYQVRGRTTLLEVLAMAQGLTPAAGSEVLIVRSAGARGTDSSFVAGDSSFVASAASTSVGMPAAATGEIVEVNLTELVESGDASLVVRPGDVVQVPSAQLVYVAGEVNRPGGFTLTAGEPITVLQALALAEGLGGTAASDRSIIVRTRDDGGKDEIPVDLEAVLDGELAAPVLEPADVLFVPNNQTKSVALGVIDAFVRMFTFRGLIY